MAYNTKVAEKIRTYLANFPDIKVEEKKMFGGMAFLIDKKMCVNVSGEKLMCRFDPIRTEELAGKVGFLPMVMKGNKLEGYCYVEPAGFMNDEDFEFWINLCFDYNIRSKSSKRR